MMHPDARQKARSWDGRELSAGTRMEQKLDGYRASLFVDASGRRRFLGRRPHADLYDSLPRCLQELLDHVPFESVVDGELHVAGEPATEVPRALKDRSALLTFSAFAAPFWTGIDKRLAGWMAHDEALDQLLVPRVQWWPLPKYATPAGLSALAEAQGIEGFVLKEEPYARWWKTKRVQTADCVVMGAVPGKGKHRGRNGSLIVGQHCEGRLIEVASVGKGRDEEWRDARIEELIGRVCEVSHEGVQSKGRLKFSSFVRWRDDKEAWECKSESES